LVGQVTRESFDHRPLGGGPIAFWVVVMSATDLVNVLIIAMDCRDRLSHLDLWFSGAQA
jgi:hypothetical protein